MKPSEQMQPRARVNVWEFARDHVDYSRSRRYETPIHSRFDPDLLPFWKPVVEWITDPAVREIVVLKCARAGASECVLLNPIRYHVARDPIPILYLGGQQEMTERFHKERIVLGMELAEETAAVMREATQAGTLVTLPDMTIVSLFPGGRSTAKQFGYQLILGDEVSMWPEYAADMLRKRAGTYRDAHIVMVSSPDPQQHRSSDEDPIFLEYYGDKERGYGASDQCRWQMPDPKTGEPWWFRMGGADEWGLKWDSSCRRANGTYDLGRVRETAHFVTPSGAVVTNAEKMAHVRKGAWVPQCATADPGKRGVHLPAMATPFHDGDLGRVAVRFLTAKANGPEALRVFTYEDLAERWYGEKITIGDNLFDARATDYKRGQRITSLPAFAPIVSGRASRVAVTVDVQASRLVWLIRETLAGGDSALVDYGECDGPTQWVDLRAIGVKYGASYYLIDNSYAARAEEVKEQVCFGAMKGAVICYGRDQIKQMHMGIKMVDPFEGTARQGKATCRSVTWKPDMVKSKLWQMVSGADPHKWLLPADHGEEYVDQMTAEECVDGAWVKKRAGNHLWDCEVLQLLCAILSGLYTDVPSLTDEISTRQLAPQRGRQPRVSYG